MNIKRIGSRKWEFTTHEVIELDDTLTEHSLDNDKFLPERDSRGWLIKLNNIPIEKVIEQVIKSNFGNGPILLTGKDHDLFWNAIQNFKLHPTTRAGR